MFFRSHVERVGRLHNRLRGCHSSSLPTEIDWYDTNMGHFEKFPGRDPLSRGCVNFNFNRLMNQRNDPQNRRYVTNIGRFHSSFLSSHPSLSNRCCNITQTTSRVALLFSAFPKIIYPAQIATVFALFFKCHPVTSSHLGVLLVNWHLSAL